MKYEENVWYGWNGGECPVHPESLVEVVFADGSKSKGYKADSWTWRLALDGSIIAFRVVKEHKEPREFWVAVREGEAIDISRNKEILDCYGYGDVIHVREVLE